MIDQRPQFSLGFRPDLNGLRGLAVLMVMYEHLLYFPVLVQSPWKDYAPKGGSLGVDLFFVLSGFLITQLLLEEFRQTGTLRLRWFYARRALRLLPALLTAISLVLGLSLLAPKLGLDLVPFWNVPKDALYVLLYLSNYAINLGLMNPISPLGVTWSLAVEEHFYLIAPSLLLWALRRRIRPRVIGYSTLGLLLACMAWRCVAVSFGDGGAAYRATHLRMDAILMGCLLALILSFWPNHQKLRQPLMVARPWLGVIFLICFWTADITAPLTRSVGLFVFDLTVTLLIAGVLLSPSPSLSLILQAKWLTYVGTISYGLYLYHWPIRLLAPAQPGWAGSAITLVASFALAALSYRFLERPILKLKTRYKVSLVKPDPTSTNR